MNSMYNSSVSKFASSSSSTPDSGFTLESTKGITFTDLGVAIEIVEALAQRSIHHAFPIQESTIPLALNAKDIIAQARTGSGKTLSFAIPVIDRVFDDAALPELDGSPHALIITPTRELAQQVGSDIDLLITRTPLKALTVYGGTPLHTHVHSLEKGADILIGTPGRIIDLYKRGALSLESIHILVLDEADEMLNLGFLPDIQYILTRIPSSRQTLLFSATMPREVLELGSTLMHNPVHIRDAVQKENTANKNVEQIIFQAHKMDKPLILAKALQSPLVNKSIIFTRTKKSASSLAQELANMGFSVAAVHGDMRQQDREYSLDAFREGRVPILVATDVAARGLDIDDISHVFNYQVPDDAMTYIHRIGRTGRAGHKGISVTMVGYDELHKWQSINQELSLGQDKPEQWFSTSPELYEALSIPENTDPIIGNPRKIYSSHSHFSSVYSRNIKQRRRNTGRRKWRNN